MLNPDALADAVATTQSKYMRGSWADLAATQPEYLATRLIAERGVEEDGGVDIKWTVNKTTAGNAQPTGFFRQVTTLVDDTMTQATVPWRFQITSWGYDDRMPIFNRGVERIIEWMKKEESNADLDMVELMEGYMWGAPVNSDDTDTPMGIQFWIQKDTTTSGSFLGGNPSGFTGGAGGISSTSVPAWRNWAGAYAQPSVEDLVRKIKLGVANTNFKAPTPSANLGFGKIDRCGYGEYNNVIEPLEREAEKRNQNLGSDLAMFVGEITIARIPIRQSFWLQNNDTSYPVYIIDHGQFRPVVQEGLNMLRLKPQRIPGQPHGWRVCKSHAMNWVCTNRRKGGFVLSR